MVTTLLVGILSARLVAAPVAAPPDPCKLVTAAEITAALGSAASAATLSAPTTDPETGAHMVSCTRTAGKFVFDVSATEFPSAAAADKALTILANTVPNDEDEAKLSPATGVGDRSLFGATKIGAHWFFQKGKITVSITLAGELGDGARYRETLKKMATSALSRL